MKSVILLLLCLNHFSFSQTMDILDEKNGYKDLKFGTPKSELKDKIYGCTAEGICVINGDSYRKIRNVTLDNVCIAFTEDKLFEIFLTLHGKANIENLMQIYYDTYGKATSNDKEELMLYWIGKYVQIDFDVDIEKDGESKATVLIASKDLMHKNKQTEIKKNLDDL